MPSSPHWGYLPTEVPRYENCEGCGFVLRADRLDLVQEHRENCDGRLLASRAPLRLVLCDELIDWTDKPAA